MPLKEKKLKRTSSRSPSRSATQFSDSSSKPVSPSRVKKSPTTNRLLSPGKKKKASTKIHRVNSGLSPSTELFLQHPTKEEEEGNPLEQIPEETGDISDSNGKKNGSRGHALQALADRLKQSLESLKGSLAEMKERIEVLEEQKRSAESESGSPISFPGKHSPRSDLSRIRQEKIHIETEILKTNRTIDDLLLLSKRLDEIHQNKLKNLGSARKKLEMEINELEIEKQMNASIIREGFVKRIHLLRRYWPWRQLLELGGTTVATTFEEELKRGPRYRHVGLQNNVRIDYLAQQIKWLESLKSRKDSFQNRLWQLEQFVEDLYDINDMIEEALSCKVCGLLYDEPVLFWPCGHSFCHNCFESLAIAPSLYRCPICGSIDSEGFLHNLLLADTVAKWMFKDLGFSDLQGPLSSIRIHLARFHKANNNTKLVKLKQILKEQSFTESQGGASDSNDITISYRMY